MHIRQQIREYILQSLLTEYSTDIQEISFDNPEIIQPDKFPFISILSNSEDIQTKIIGKPRIYESNYKIDIIILVKSRNGLNLLDDLSIKLQEFFANNEKLNNLVGTSLLENIDFNYNDELEKNIYGVKYTYNLIYRFKEDDPETSLG